MAGGRCAIVVDPFVGPDSVHSARYPFFPFAPIPRLVDARVNQELTFACNKILSVFVVTAKPLNALASGSPQWWRYLAHNLSAYCPMDCLWLGIWMDDTMVLYLGTAYCEGSGAWRELGK